MKRQSFNTFTVVAGLLLASLGCGLFVEDTPTPQPITTQIVTTPLQQPVATQSPQSQPENLTSAQKQLLAHSTVRILMAKKQSGKMVPFGSGSGTILSADGVILTNAHVASPASRGNPEEEPDGLIVEMVDKDDEPPIAKYFASVKAVDGTLDLAVIKIDRNLDGSSVKSQSLNLPFVKLGNSDNVRFGDPIFIFGFPGIGGNTITYTSGSVSGFDSMQLVGNRAWIKTDATIAGGNSGGLATNVYAEIIGIPTRLGTSSADQITDCRRIADTNGDGKIDEKDTCIPAGGFINAVRPVNWALPLIQAALNQTAYTSPYKTTATSPTQTNPKASTGNFTLNNWAADIDQNNCPVKIVQSYPTGTLKIFAVFRFGNMTKGDTWSYRWMLDNREISKNQSAWKANTSGDCFSFSLSNNDKALPDGLYKLEIFSGSSLTLSGSSQIKVGAASPNQTGKTLTVKGKVLDSNTGRPVAGIYVIVLNPGIDPDQWLQDNGSDNDIYTYTQTDQNGAYQLPDPLLRGESYGVVSGSNKLGYPSVTGYIEPTDKDPDPLSITIKVSK